MLLMLIFGIIEIIVVIFAFIYARDKPFLGAIALTVASAQAKDVPEAEID